MRAYECDGVRYDYFPMQQSVLYPKHVEPVYEELPGWKGQDISGCRTFEELPQNAQDYVTYLENLVGVPMSIIAVGPDRDQTIFRGCRSRRICKRSFRTPCIACAAFFGFQPCVCCNTAGGRR